MKMKKTDLRLINEIQPLGMVETNLLIDFYVSM